MAELQKPLSHIGNDKRSVSIKTTEGMLLPRTNWPNSSKYIGFPIPRDLYKEIRQRCEGKLGVQERMKDFVEQALRNHLELTR